VILHRLELRRFLGLADHTFEFAPGFNVVVGPNEAGKSTLRTAIRTVLYENPATASSRYREQFRTWRVDEPPELRLHFELAGRRFTLTKNYATRKVVLADSIGQTWEQHKSVQERLVDALGLPTDDQFDATAHIAQTHLERIHVTSIG
jgi:DNA repair exonuclease SbcCD ATPase subunit